MVMDARVKGTVGFFEDVNDATDLTETVGSFKNCNLGVRFDNIFEDACANFKTNWKTDWRTGFVKRDILENDTAVKSFKNDLLRVLFEDCAKMPTKPELKGDAGTAPLKADTVSALFDNKVQSYIEESATVGDLMPIKTIDFPLLVKGHIKESFHNIVETETVNSLIVKKRVEHMIVYNRKDPSQAWEYPQCMYDPEFQKLIAAGEGVDLATDPQTLPLVNFNMIEGLTDIPVVGDHRVVIDLTITEVVTSDDVRLRLPTPMHVNLADGAWIGGKLDLLYDKDGKVTNNMAGTSMTSSTIGGPGGTMVERKRLQDILSGFTDFGTNTTTITSATGSVKAVVFKGKLSNEYHENTIRSRYTQSDYEWTIGEGCTVDASYTLEQLKEHKALADFDLYKRSYEDIHVLLSAMADKKGYMWLDEVFKMYEDAELSPLDWNPVVLKTFFDCDSSTKTVALPSEYIAKELKFLIDRFVIDIADTVKLEDLHFVLWGNPRFVSLLNPAIKWVFQAGQSVGGVKLDYSYGVMTSGDVKIYVVSSKLVDARTHVGLRLIPFFDNGITFKRYKFSTDVVTSKESAYKDPDHVGGSQTYVFGVERYADIYLQAIQGEIALKNTDFVYIK